MNTIREIQRINEEELKRGISGTSASWHDQYSKAPWVYVGNLDHELTEGDILTFMSQFGEIEDIHLVREEDTGKSRGFAFCKYEDPRSCILAVDNFVGVEILGRPLRVDHVDNYRLPKNILEKQQEKGEVFGNSEGVGHAYDGVELENQFNLRKGQDLFAAPVDEEKQKRKEERAKKREEKEKKRKRKEEKREKHEKTKKRKISYEKR